MIAPAIPAYFSRFYTDWFSRSLSAQLTRAAARHHAPISTRGIAMAPMPAPPEVSDDQSRLTRLPYAAPMEFAEKYGYGSVGFSAAAWPATRLGELEAPG